MKISKIDINNFRGIPDLCSLDFCDKSGNPCSAIIYGGNGSGKSSVVDAIELNLQGRIARSTVLHNPYRPTPRNLASPVITDSTIKLTFEDGSVNVRGIGRTHNKEGFGVDYISPNTKLYPSYEFVPFVLRRNDIISYLTTDTNKRQILISQFIFSSDIDKLLPDDPETIAISNERKKKAVLLKELLSKISELTSIPLDELEKNRHYLQFINFINAKVSPESKGNTYSKSGNRLIKINNASYHIAICYANSVVKLDKEIREANQKKLKSKKIPKTNIFTNIISPYIEPASKYLSDSFKLISNVDYIKSIEIEIAKETAVSLRINVVLNNGKKVEPHQVFSEANFDLMILLLYLSIIRVGVDKGQEKVLILDDVLQSVDSTIRAKFISFILENLKDWQLIITCHDRLWLSQLKFLFQRAGHKFNEYSISNWSFSGGPYIERVNYSHFDDTLKKAIDTQNIRIIASMSGLFLEKLCQKLSVSLMVSIQRRFEDKYTIGDLWPGIKKILLKTTLKELVNEIDNLLFVRNLLGCHYNEWAETLSDTEVTSFATAIESLYEKTFCEKCINWVSDSSNKDIIAECACRNLQYSKV